MPEGIKELVYPILKEELIPALGCTEPIAIAYASAKARLCLREGQRSTGGVPGENDGALFRQHCEERERRRRAQHREFKRD